MEIVLKEFGSLGQTDVQRIFRLGWHRFGYLYKEYQHQFGVLGFIPALRPHGLLREFDLCGPKAIPNRQPRVR